MKRFLLVLSVFIFLPCLNVYGDIFDVQGSTPLTPMFVVDSTLNAIMTNSYADQVIHYTQMVKDNIEQIKNFVEMVKNTEKQIEMAAQNLRSVKDVDSWDDFMDFYNRQLYLERQAIESTKNLNVNIGKKNYSLYDLEGIADGLKDTYVEYWDKEFSEEQRREMWLGLGLSPSNYAYVQPYRQKGLEIARELRTLSAVQNEKNMKDSKKNKKKKDDLAKNDSLPPEQQKGQNELLGELLDTAIQTDEKLSDLTAIEAKRAEMEGNKAAAERPLYNEPKLSNWNDKKGMGFSKPLKK